jgi:hypothetical protein
MGIIVHDSYQMTNGLVVSDYYINIDDIHIFKSDDVYSVSLKYKSFIDKNARDTDKKPFCEMNLILSTTTFENIGTQIYDEVKKRFENYTDCI